MKTVKTIILIVAALLLSNTLSAQISVGINIGTPHAARYYYLQDIEAYYDNQASMYIYLSGGNWIRARRLPASYGHYDLNNGHKILINDYRGNRPYSYYHAHRNQFPKNHYGNAEKNHWSAKEYKNNQKKHFKEAKQYRKAETGNYRKNGNNGNGNNGNNGNGRGNGKGRGKGK